MTQAPSSYDDPSRPSQRPAEPDSYGQAALLLGESILHALMEAGTLSLDQTLAAVRTAAEVKVDLADEIAESDNNLQRSLELLRRIEHSLVTDNAGAGRADFSLI